MGYRLPRTARDTARRRIHLSTSSRAVVTAHFVVALCGVTSNTGSAATPSSSPEPQPIVHCPDSAEGPTVRSDDDASTVVALSFFGLELSPTPIDGVPPP